MLFNSFVISIVYCSSLSNTILSGNPCNFYILFLNSLTNLSADISSIIAIKCIILNNLLQTTRIVSFPATIGNFVIKSTIKYIHSFFRISLNFSFSTNAFILFFILWHILQPSIYLSTSLVTPNH